MYKKAHDLKPLKIIKAFILKNLLTCGKTLLHNCNRLLGQK